MRKDENNRLNRWVKKVKALHHLNIFSCSCGENNVVKLCFHHSDGEEKEHKISQIRNYSFDKIKNEIDKCEVMCQNCHQEHHSKMNINKSSEFKRKNKILFMQFLEKSGCERCGYDKCLDSIDFHHKNSESKRIEFRIYRNVINSISDISEHLKTELDSCEVLCRNCHMDEHHGDYFRENEKVIFEKSKTFKGKQSKLPVDKVIEMFKSGMRQIEIAKHFGASKGTISGILKRNRDLI